MLNTHYNITLWLRLILLVLLLLLLSTSTLQASNRRARKCLQPAEGGRCFGFVPSYAYNPYTRKCEDFIYGGCGGNDNRFISKIECEQACRDV